MPESELKPRLTSSLAAVMVGMVLIAMAASACVTSTPSHASTEASSMTLSERETAAPNAWIPDVVDATARSIVNVTVRRADGVGTGTGIVFDSGGSIITNWHVIEGAEEIEITSHSGASYDATLLREDSSLDLALLQIESGDLTPATFGNSDVLRVGEDVVSIGHAFGLSGGPSVSRGVVSALNRTVADEDGNIFDGLIQTDAVINLGSSGGALVSSAGEVIGINLGTINVGQGANFALDINTAVAGARRLVALGERESPGYLGVGGVDVTPYIAFQQALPVSEGFGVRYVDPDSPAAVGFKIHDIIVGIDDTPIRGKIDFTEFLRTHPRGTDIVVTAVRGAGEDAVIMEIPVTLGAPGA